MADMEIRIRGEGFDALTKQIDPKQVYTILNLWFDRASRLVHDELKYVAPGRLKNKTYIKMDLMRPPRWARISVKSPLTWLVEGGTGTLGDPAFKHDGAHWPSTKGIMRQTGLPEAQAFLVARTIGLRGGNPPRPFIKPTYEVTKRRAEEMVGEIVDEVLKI